MKTRESLNINQILLEFFVKIRKPLEFSNYVLDPIHPLRDRQIYPKAKKIFVLEKGKQSYGKGF